MSCDELHAILDMLARAREVGALPADSPANHPTAAVLRREAQAALRKVRRQGLAPTELERVAVAAVFKDFRGSK